jgi:hypothetical protein
MRILAGHCTPADHPARACDDAGMPIYVPVCGDEANGTRLEITTGERLAVSFTAYAIDIIPGPMPGGTWAFGSTQRAILAKARVKQGDEVHEDVRVVAVALKPDEWQAPPSEFSEVAYDAKNGTFTFWRKAVCLEGVGCTSARWEATNAGLRLVTTERDMYESARARTRQRMDALRAQTPACPVPAVLGAARIYMYSRVLGDSEKDARTELDRNTAHLETSGCKKNHGASVKPMGALRGDIVREVRNFLTPRTPKKR